MTMRGIKDDRKTGYYEEKVPIKGKEDQGGVRQIKTMQGIPGIEERMQDHNFWLQPRTLKSLRNEKGLHDVSATLIDPKRTLKIGGDDQVDGKKPNQIYRLTGDTIYVFMPVPSEEDHLVFYLLNDMAKKPEATSAGFRAGVRLMRSRLTRIKIAFEDDAGCKFIDLAPEGEDFVPKFRYGLTAMKKVSPFTKVKMSDSEVNECRMAALKYKSILTGANRNEIVVAYRQHGLRAMPTCFPMFAKHVFVENKHIGYNVVDREEKPTGRFIDLHGNLS
ncbi:MAG TPA: hypothetical protein PKD86_12735 [Gemmatales bacterium]|nr:hypothetical protein [Gemmatales bacterium]HMP60209.1 hypothetical protein [Gemmatales bacterium]